MQKSLLFFIGFYILLISCGKSVPDLNGHWHIYPENGDGSYNTLDIIQDSVCQWDLHSFWFDGGGRVDFPNRHIHVFNYNGSGTYVFSGMKGDEMKLRGLHNEFYYRAKKCRQECCSRLEDYMKDLIVDIQLPKNVNPKLKRKMSKKNSAYLFYGTPDENHNQAYGNDVRFCLNNQFSTVYTLPHFHFNRRTELKGERPNYKIIADRKTSLRQISNVVRELNKIGIREIYIATGFDPEENLNDPFYFINTKALDLSISEMTWEEYLNNGE